MGRKVKQKQPLLMCVTFLFLDENAIGHSDKYQLILLNNRDESFDRPTSQATWEDGILAGRDEALSERPHGTWLGMRRDGRIGVLLSMLQPKSTLRNDAVTRGKIVIDYLSSNLSAVEYGYQVSCDAYQYNGFNLLLLDRVWRNGHKVYRLVNFINEHSQSSPEELDSGLYGFGNSLRTRPFKKVRRGVELLKRYVENREESESKEETLSKLLRILKDDQSTFPDEQILSQTEQPEELSKAMSQIFYKLPPPYRYGTRSHTILLIDGSNRVTYLESSRDDNCDGIKWHDVRHEFTLDE